jgi:hypothetical protein
VTEPAAFADPLTARLAAFIREIGLVIEPARLDDEASLLPGVTVKDGRLLVDEARLAHPGDLLHEAGHLAVSDPALRPTLAAVGDDPGEEMAAIAWSYAAARFLGIDPALVFHAEGYGGGGETYLAALASGGVIGQPMLGFYGMTRVAPGLAEGEPAYPHMLRWLR